jgi:hypothetical protein
VLPAADDSSVSDAVELACAPPVLWPPSVLASGVADESVDDEPSVSVVVVVAAAELGERLDALSSVDDEADVLDEPDGDELDDEVVSDGSARATPGMVATADPIPSATANAPTRPTYLT